MDLQSKLYVKNTRVEADREGNPCLVLQLDIPEPPGSDVWKDAFRETEDIVQRHAQLHPNASVRYVDMSGHPISP